jgi:hypothetical protein
MRHIVPDAQARQGVRQETLNTIPGFHRRGTLRR